MKTTRMRVGAVATVCALVGAGAGIAGTNAATSTSKSTAKTTAKKRAAAKRSTTVRREGRRGFGGPGFHGGPPVHEEVVVLDKAGKAYITQTTDSGVVKSVSGDELVITEGTTTVPYKDVTVKVPSDATVVRNGTTAKLADLKAGDRVRVTSSSDGTFVFAGDDTFRPGPGFGPGGRGRGHGPDADSEGPDGDSDETPPAGAPAP